MANHAGDKQGDIVAKSRAQSLSLVSPRRCHRPEMLSLLSRRTVSARLALARALRQHASDAAGGALEADSTSPRRPRPSNTPVWLALAAVGVLGAGVAGRESLREAPEAARAVLALSRALLAELTEAGEARPDGGDTGALVAACFVACQLP
jgi:hypothetical protein